MKPIACLALSLIAASALAASPEPPAEPAAPTGSANADRDFAEALEACRAATHQGPHPFVKGFVIEHTITSETEGKCGYSQSMPGAMTMDCKLSAQGRAALATEFRDLAEGRMSGGTAAQPSWSRECEIVTKDGKRMPMSPG